MITRSLAKSIYIVVFSISALVACNACNSGRGGSVTECGGGAQFPCPPGAFCDFGSACGGLDRVGRCRYQPQSCPPEDSPVCGCDKKTYSSPCYANASGVSIAYEGECLKGNDLDQ